MPPKLKRAEIIVPCLILLGGIGWIAISAAGRDYHNVSMFLVTLGDYRDALFMIGLTIAILILLKKQRDKNRQYQTLFDGSPVPMWIFDRSTLCFLDVNLAAVEHYGYSRAEFLRMTIKDIRPAFEHEKLERHILAIRDRQDNKDNWVHIKKNGEQITVTVTSSNVYYKGEICRLSVANDITDMLRAHENRKAAETAAKEKAALVEEQNRRLREIAFKASHLMRAPLTNVLGLVNLLTEPGIALNEKQQLLPALKIAGEQLDLIIRDIVAETLDYPATPATWRDTHRAVMQKRQRKDGNPS